MAAPSAAGRAQRVLERCDALAACSEEPDRLTRPYGGPALQRARKLVSTWMQEAGMTVRADAIGNLRGRYEGGQPASPALLLGSHLDSVRDAGRYDGPLGVLVALAAVEELAAEGRRLEFPIEIVAFPDEEGLRFQTTYLGSSVLAGSFDPELLRRTDENGLTLRQAIDAFGGNPDALAAAALRPGEAFAYVEVHIEQGPHLESIDAPLGVVTAISGQTRVLVSFTGEAGHAGTVAMHLRRDPMPAAAELVLAAEALAREQSATLATVGQLLVSPGATNVIPGRVEMSLDVRHPADAEHVAALSALESRARKIAANRSLLCDWQIMRDHPAVICDEMLTLRLGEAMRAVGLPVEALPSGAGHDAVAMASCLPIAMLFVRCAGGISHNPAESVTADDAAAAIRVIDRLLVDLSGAEMTNPHRRNPGKGTSHAARFDLIIRGGSVVTPDAVLIADVAVSDGVIVEISPEIEGSVQQVIDARSLTLLPGAVDMHVHFNEPGRAEWEGWATGSLACAVGGTTTVVDMPLNASPPTLDGASFDAKRQAAEASSIVDFALWGGLTPINLDTMEDLADRGVVGFKAFMSSSGIADFPRADDTILCEGMKRAAALGLPVAVHAEDETLTAALAANAIAAGTTGFADYLASRPMAAELDAIRRAIDIAEETGCALHVAHVSTASGAKEIANARTRGLEVSAETCPHYLSFSEEDIGELGALAKCAPPLRPRSEVALLRQAVARGEIQIVASDHSPCPPEMKAGDDIFAVWGGIAGCQSLLSALLRVGLDDLGASLPTVMKLVADAPARRLRLPGKGRIAIGYDADLVLVEMGQSHTLEARHLRYRHQISPFVGMTFPARIRRTMLRGMTIVVDGQPIGAPGGRLLKPMARPLA